MKRLSERMEAAQEVIDGERVRWLLGKKIMITRKENVFGKQIAENRYDLILANATESEFTRRLILKELEVGPKGAVEIAGALDMDPAEVLQHLISLRRWRFVEAAGEREGHLLFRPIKRTEAPTKLGGED